jgi:hypothetical protein
MNELARNITAKRVQSFYQPAKGKFTNSQFLPTILSLKHACNDSPPVIQKANHPQQSCCDV